MARQPRAQMPTSRDGHDTVLSHVFTTDDAVMVAPAVAAVVTAVSLGAGSPPVGRADRWSGGAAAVIASGMADSVAIGAASRTSGSCQRGSASDKTGSARAAR